MKSSRKIKTKHQPKSIPLPKKRGVLRNPLHYLGNLARQIVNLTRKNPLLSLITLFGLLIRLLGTNPGYPQIHSDEPSIQEATRILVMYHKYDPQNYYYGSLLSIIYAVFIVFIGIPTFFVQVLLKDMNSLMILGGFGFLEYFFQKVEHGGYYFDTFYNFVPYWTRYGTAILSSAAIVLVFLLCSELFRNKKAGFIAAFLTAVCYRHVLSSTLTLADAPTAVFMLLSLLLSARLIKNQQTKTYLWAGLGIGLALSVKYFIYILPAFFICSIIGNWTKNRTFLKNCQRFIFNKNLYLALFIAASVFVVINPYLFINKEEVNSQMYINAKRYGLDFPTIIQKVSPPFDNLISPRVHYPYWYLFRYGYGQLLSATIVLGILYSIIRYKRQAFIILSVLVPYFFLFSAISGNTPVRNYAQITPLLLIFPALLLSDLSRKVSKKSLGKIILVALTLLVSFQTMRNSILSSYFGSLPLNYNNYFSWMNKHVPDGLVIARTQGSLIQKDHIGIPLLLYDGGIGLSLEELRATKAKYVIFTTTDTTLSNMTTFSTYNSVIANSFLDDTQLWMILNNTYLTLSLRELAPYASEYFSKPFWQSLEPAIMVVKIPSEQRGIEEKRIITETFEGNKNFRVSGSSPVTGTEKFTLLTTTGINNSQALSLPFAVCRDLQALKLLEFPTAPDFRYRIAAKVKRAMNREYKQYGNGFLRLDFYETNGKILQSHVTRLAQKDSLWEALNASGIAPNKSEYATVSFQTDICLKNESYAVDDIEAYRSMGNKITESPSDGKIQLPQNFIWLPEIL